MIIKSILRTGYTLYYRFVLLLLKPILLRDGQVSCKSNELNERVVEYGFAMNCLHQIDATKNLHKRIRLFV